MLLLLLLPLTFPPLDFETDKKFIFILFPSLAKIKIKMSGKPRLYYIKESPPCHTVIAVARLLAIDLELIDVAESYQSKQYAKINPFNRVPTFVDTDGFRLFESRAIAMYLVQSRGPPDSALYPANDLKQRAEIDQYLHFELGTLYRGLSDVIDPFWKSGEIDRSRKPSLEKALQWLDALLATNNRPFIAPGPRLSLADLSAYFYLRILAAFTSELDSSVYRAVAAWQRTVAEELKPITADGFFEEALDSLKEYCEQMRQGVREF